MTKLLTPRERRAFTRNILEVALVWVIILGIALALRLCHAGV